MPVTTSRPRAIMSAADPETRRDDLDHASTTSEA